MTEQKNILFITLRSDMGGGPKHVYDLCTNLKDVKIYIASPLMDPYGKKYQECSIEHFRLPHRKFRIRKLFGLLMFCKKNNITTVHSHGRGAGIYSRFLALFGFRVIHTFHGLHNYKGVKARINLMLERCLSILTDTFISVSNSEKKHAKNLGLAKNIEVIINGIDLEDYKEVTAPKLNILGAISRLDNHKNNEELIKFMVNIEGYTLKIAGEGQDRKHLEQIIADLNLEEKVKLIGEVSDIKLFLNEIDVYVSSSRSEGLPYSLLEAMVSNKKILVSKVSGHIDLLNHENMYTLGDIYDFKKKLSRASIANTRDLISVKEMAEKVNYLY